MNKVIKRSWIILILILVVAARIIYVYDPFSSSNRWPSSLSSYFIDTGLYRIDPGTILASLEQGNMNVFLPDARSLDERVNGPVLYTQPVFWSQSDNLKIVSALNTFVWKDKLSDWSLFDITFGTDCQDNINGLPGGDFQYFKTTFDKGKIVYAWREIEIDAQYSYVAWGGGLNLPHPLLGLKSIDLNKLKVAAEDAIRIAEENGGREARLGVKNQCYIYIFFMPQRYKGWLVDYQSTDFEIEIDPYTGEIIK